MGVGRSVHFVLSYQVCVNLLLLTTYCPVNRLSIKVFCSLLITRILLSTYDMLSTAPLPGTQQ